MKLLLAVRANSPDRSFGRGRRRVRDRRVRRPHDLIGDAVGLALGRIIDRADLQPGLDLRSPENVADCRRAIEQPRIDRRRAIGPARHRLTAKVLMLEPRFRIVPLRCLA